MSNYIQTNWTPTELEIISSSLADRVELKTLEMMLPKRSPNAIIAKAKDDFNYGTKTDNGTTKFYFDVKRRVGKNILSERAAGEAVTTTNSDSFQLSEGFDNTSDAIIADISSNSDYGFEANMKAIHMLTSEGVLITPLIVYQLSTHILNNK